jgi:hypothetical protein
MSQSSRDADLIFRSRRVFIPLDDRFECLQGVTGSISSKQLNGGSMGSRHIRTAMHRHLFNTYPGINLFYYLYASITAFLSHW